MKLEPVLALSTGIFAGMGTALSVVAVPAIWASSDPLPSWKELYRRGSKLAIGSIMISTATGLTIYCSTGKKEPMLLVASGLSFVVMPYTLLFMKPTNDALFAIANGDDSKENEVRILIAKWSKLQWVRTALALGAFSATIGLFCKK